MNKKLIMNKKGITLIALVITIIVILILAGITISMITSQDGILKKAVEAKERTEKSTNEEKIKLAYIGALDENTLTVDKKKLAQNLGIEESDITGKKDLVIKIDGKNIGISENGNVEELEDLKEIDLILDGYFQDNNLKYKCRYGYITGIKPGEMVKTLQDKLPSEYTICKEDKSEISDKENTRLATGMTAMKENEEVARIVIFGDVDCNGFIGNNDIMYNDEYIYGSKNEIEKYQEAAMDVDHDGYITRDDTITIIKAGNDVTQINQKHYVEKLKDISNIEKIDEIGLIEKINISDDKNFEKITDEEYDEVYYKVKLNKEYTYQEIENNIINNIGRIYQSDIEFQDSEATKIKFVRNNKNIKVSNDDRIVISNIPYLLTNSLGYTGTKTIIIQINL